MRKNNTKPLRLATTANWPEMNKQIEKSVHVICGEFDHHPPIVEALLFLVDLLTNEGYDAVDRAQAARGCQRAAFRYTPEFEDAQEAYLNRVNPGRAQLAKVS